MPHLLRILLALALAPGTMAAFNPTAAAQMQAAPEQAQGGASALVTLKGNTHPLALARFDQGAAPSGMAAERQLLILKRSAQQEAALESFLRSVQDPRSAEYLKFITPERFGALYGPSDAELQTVAAWLQSQGFTVNGVNKGRTALEFSGTVGLLETAFHTSIHSYLIGGERHWANASDPMIPAALAPLIAGVASLNDFKPEPHLVRGPSATWNPGLHRFEPQLTISNSGSNYLFVVPGDAATIYDAPNALNANLKAAQAVYDGTGVTIGIVSDTDFPNDSFENYRGMFGLPGNPISYVWDGNQSNLGTADDTEALLDVEVSGALAPGANLRVYAAGDTLFQSGVILAAYRAIEDNAVNILNASFGECEAKLGAAGNLEVLNLWQQAAAQGIAVTVSSGDSGSAGCDDKTAIVASNGLAVNGLASTPYNIAVGGTDFDALASHFSTYVSASNATDYTSATGYIPENPWNDSTSVNGLLASNQPEEVSGKTNIMAGGGGASSQGNANGSGGLSGYAKPGWQASYPLSDTDAVRDLPDVSLLSATGMYGALWALCGDTDCTGPNPTISGVGGTSASAPAFAGILALVNQKAGATTRLGQAGWVLYRLAQTVPGVFHAVTTGNISVYCSTGSTNCGSNNFMTGYNAGSGYNFATGLGSVDIAQLVNHWGDVSLTSTQTTLNLGSTSFVHGTSVSVSASINSTAASGNVAIVNNSSTAGQGTTNSAPLTLALAGGAGTGSYSQFPGGTYNVYASYGGDGTYAGSTSAGIQVKVTPEDSILNLSAAWLNSSAQAENLAGQVVPLGTLIDLDAQPVGKAEAAGPNPPADATGDVYFVDSVMNSGTTVPLDSSGNAVIHTTGMSAGSHSFNAEYNGGLSYNGSTSPAISFTVAKGPSSIGLTANTTSNPDGQVTLDAQIMTSVASNLLNSDGVITFTDTTNNTVLGTAPSNGEFCAASDTSCYSGALDLYETQLAMGANAIVASYGGNGNFLASAPSSPVIVTCTAGCANATGKFIYLDFRGVTTGIISAGGTITATVDVVPEDGFTGAVNVTCSITGKNSSDTKIPTCSFSPGQIAVSSTGSDSSMLTISSTAATTSLLERGRRFPWYEAGEPVLAIVLLFGIPALRQRRRALLGMLLIAVAATWVSGCNGGGGGSGGGGGGGGGGIPGTTADVYTVTFRAADAATGTVTAQDYFNFTVQ
jgi:hypothetical protein